MARIDNMVNNCDFSFRSILTIPRDVNFGFEIEMVNVDYSLISKVVSKYSRFSTCTDKSLKENKNCEVNTRVLNNNRDDLNLLKKLCSDLSRFNPSFDGCSLQINFDGDLLRDNREKVLFLKLFAVYEDIIYRFSCGVDENIRDSHDMYAYPIIFLVKNYLNDNDRDKLFSELTNQKRYGVNFKRDGKIIEFRSPNGTVNPVLMENYVTFFYYFINLVKSSKINELDLDNYIRDYFESNFVKAYMVENSDKASDLSSIMFNNTHDKVYFMHQYLRK